jgi:hypothetical protein
LDDYKRFGVVTSALVLLTGCTTLPLLDEATGGIPITEIVLRIKCELSDAVSQTYEGYLDPSVKWMDDWTTQIDLTLEILDSATFAPGATVMHPFHNAYSVVAGPSSESTSGVLGTTLSAIPQGFALAGGLSVNGQASRTQTLSFNYSFAELKRRRAQVDTPTKCAVSDGMDLRGRLGLKEWFAEALTPVQSQLLYAGYHPKPQGATPSAQPRTSPMPSAAPADTTQKVPAFGLEAVCPPEKEKIDLVHKNLLDANTALLDSSLEMIQERIQASTSAQLASLNSFKSNIEKAAHDVDSKIDSGKKYTGVLDPFVAEHVHTVSSNTKQLLSKEKDLETIISDNLTGAAQNASAAAKTVLIAQSQIATAQRDLNNANCHSIDTVVNNSDIALDTAKNAILSANAAQRDVAKAGDNIVYLKTLSGVLNGYSASLKPIDPPLTTIGQSIQFVLQKGGNVTPTWTFVTFKGPNAPFLSGTATRTHMLNITAGPATTTSANANPALYQNQLNLLLNNRLPLLRP